MYKYLFIFGLFFSSFACAQSNYTTEQVEKSTDPQVIANFIKFNPTHPRTPEFKRKLLAVINNDKSPAQKAAVAKPTVKAINTEKLEKAVNRGNAKGEPSEKNKRTAELLTHIFSNDVYGTTAYVQIINKSKSNLIVKISGKKIKN